jgi:hypothetical protein
VTNFAGTIPAFVGANDLSTIPPALLPYYTTSQGTSFSTPQVSGIVALMMEANPLLTPDQVVTILRQTATPMPYEQRVVGAGYVDAHNAVRTATSLSPVAHPANLFPSNDPNAPQIVDATDDQIGTTAQDIREAYFRYDAVANQIVYRLRVSDASVRTPENALDTDIRVRSDRDLRDGIRRRNGKHIRVWKDHDAPDRHAETRRRSVRSTSAR